LIQTVYDKYGFQGIDEGLADMDFGDADEMFAAFFENPEMFADVEMMADDLDFLLNFDMKGGRKGKRPNPRKRHPPKGDPKSEKLLQSVFEQMMGGGMPKSKGKKSKKQADEDEWEDEDEDEDEKPGKNIANEEDEWEDESEEEKPKKKKGKKLDGGMLNDELLMQMMMEGLMGQKPTSKAKRR